MHGDPNFHVVSGIYIRQYVNSSFSALTKMAKIGTRRIITNLQYIYAISIDFYAVKYEIYIYFV